MAQRTSNKDLLDLVKLLFNYEQDLLDANFDKQAKEQMAMQVREIKTYIANELDDKALTVNCPRCMALAHFMCRSEEGKLLLYTHSDRFSELVK